MESGVGNRVLLLDHVQGKAMYFEILMPAASFVREKHEKSG